MTAQKFANAPADLIEGGDEYDLSLVDHVDEIGALAEEEKQIKARLAKIAEERNKLFGRLNEIADAEGLDQDDTQKFEGDEYVVTLGKRGTSRSIVDMEAIFHALGHETFLSLCSFPLGKVDDHLNAKERDAVLETTRTIRSMTVKPSGK